MNRANSRLGAAAATLAMLVIPAVSVAESFALATHAAPAGMEFGGHMLPPDAVRFADRYFPQGRAPTNSDPGIAKALELVPGGNGDASAADATVDWSSLAPYVGMGFGNSVNGGRWSFAFDLGVMFTGLLDFARSGAAHLQVREPFNPEDPFSEVKYYPVLSLGLAYRF
ncbi:MAG: hypothetical protein ACNA8G_03770 [Gammaproteobacteria bacterium]